MFAAYLNAHSLHELLGQPGDYRPFPRRQARGAWNDLPESRRAQILAWADEAKQGYPMVTATQFLAFCRTGDRMAYEKPYFTRRNRLMGAALFDALESVYQATNGCVSFYDEPMIRRIAAFPMHAHIAGAYFVNFADCDAKPKLDGQRIALFGRRTGQPDLERFGLWLEGQRTSVRPVDTPQMSRVLQSLFAGNGQADEPKGEAFSALPSLQVFAWRKGGLYAAIKGGHNGESHNHNDIGSFIVYADGKPEIIDVGNCVYTAQTFGPRRYELMNTRSKNHNVPLIGETEQAAGREHRARDVAADENGARMELAGAYPEEAGVRSLARTLAVSEDELELTDEVTLDAEKPVTFVFMLRHRPTVQNGQAHFGKLCMTFDASLDVRVEEIHVTDARMAKNFPGSVWRMTMTSREAKEHRQIFALK